MSVGLVLEGGGMRGMYTAGVLDVFMDNNINIDGIVGVSAGVLFGINYVSGQRGRVLRYNKRFAKDKRYMGLWSLLTTGNIVSKDFSYYEIPTKLDVFDEKAFEESKTKFYATVTNVMTGKPEYIKLDNVIKQMEVLRATSSMPFVSELIEIDGEKYLDGGISDSIPVDKCRELGYDKVIVVLTRPIDYRKRKGNPFLAKVKYRKYPELVRAINERYRNYNGTVEKIIDMENEKEIFVIRPSRKVNIKRIERDADKIQEMYELGVYDCNKVLEALKVFLNI